jgi:hypothetical protein
MHCNDAPEKLNRQQHYMDQETVIAELESLVGSLGLTIRYEKGDFKGGDCILFDQNLVVMNRKTSPAQKVALLSRVVGLYGGGDLYMKPAVRRIVDEEMARYHEQLRTMHNNSGGDEHVDTHSERSQS